MSRTPLLFSLCLLAGAGLGGCSDKGGDGDSGGDGGSSLVECEHGNSRADEVCDGFDNDCDGEVDEDLPTSTWYTDGDGDGHGDDASTVLACAQPDGAVATGGDCDDADGAVHPAAAEVCDEVDNDCDDLVDEQDGDLQGGTAAWIDQDGDGYGGDAGFYFCTVPEGFADNDDDCDDDDATAGSTITWYRDSDGDGYGADGTTRSQCEQPSGYVRDGGDCDEADVDVNPGMDEVCRDGADNDCDGTDNGCTSWEGLVYVSEADWSITHGGSNASYHLSGGDVDGDGVQELVGGAPYSGTYSYGQVYVYDKLVEGTSASSAGTRYQVLGTGTTGGYYLGFFSAAIPDTDGDGYDEIVASDASSYLSLYDPPFAATMYDVDYDVQWSDGPSSSSGMSPLAGLDFDGDGRGELAVSVPSYSYGASYGGVVWLLDAPQTTSRTLASSYHTVLYGSTSSGYFGYSVSTAGDVDGDGLDDLAVGEYRNGTGASTGGAAYVFSGADLRGGAVSAGYYHLGVFGTYSGGQLGFDVGGPGDLDDDGYDDLLAGAPYDATYGSSGAAYLVLGGPGASGLYDYSSDHIFYTSGGQPYLGYRVDFAGDLDDDGHDEVVVGHLGSSLAGSSGGAAAIWYGGLSSGSHKASAADTSIIPTTSGGYLGGDVSGVGDVSGDGIDDLAVGWYSYGYVFGFNGGTL